MASKLFYLTSFVLGLAVVLFASELVNIREILALPALHIRHYYPQRDSADGLKSPTNNSRDIQFTAVHWVKDDVWFQAESNRGCCPHAKRLYGKRYERVEYRCCTSRLWQLEPLRAMGGADFTDLFAQFNNMTVLIQGDSLAEQHFLGMLCFAWSTNVPVDLVLEADGGDDTLSRNGVIWRADLGHQHGRGEPADASPRLTLLFVRQNQPMLAKLPSIMVNYSSPQVLILGGWHHGRVGLLTGLVEQVSIVRPFPLATLLVEALPNHWPGAGNYAAGSQSKLATNATADHRNGTTPNNVCDASNPVADPNVNHLLDQLVKHTNSSPLSIVNVIRVQHLYTDRGIAHVGPTPKSLIGLPPCDCLHWCIAPGVLDGLVRETLASVLVHTRALVVPQGQLQSN